MVSKLLVERSSRRIHNIDRHAGIVSIEHKTSLILLHRQSARCLRHAFALPASAVPVRRSPESFAAQPCSAAVQCSAATRRCSSSPAHTLFLECVPVFPQCVAGLLPDGRQVVNRAADEASNYKS